MKIRNLAIDIISILFILLFTYAAVSKLLDFQKFTVQLGQSPILTAIAGVVAWIVPAIELLIVIMLSLARFRTLGLYASFSLMVMFTVYIILITHFSEYIPCSCGGILQDMTWNQHLLFNVVFILMALISILLNNEPLHKTKSLSLAKTQAIL